MWIILTILTLLLFTGCRPSNPVQPQPTRTAQANSAWRPVTQSFDGVMMVLVPVGCFNMGSENGNVNERPVHRQCFKKPFWMDQYEVTNAQFNQFGGVAANASNWTDDNRPRERVTWFEARDFCVKRGARLPTEAEWEYAARGGDNMTYPWGHEFNADFAVHDTDQTAEVGSKLEGQSWVGALDMSGNVYEMTSTIYGIDQNADLIFMGTDEVLYSYPYVLTDGRELDSDNTTDVRVIRGGAWDNASTDFLRTTYRSEMSPADSSFLIGFRCARNS